MAMGERKGEGFYEGLKAGNRGLAIVLAPAFLQRRDGKTVIFARLPLDAKGHLPHTSAPA